MVARLGWQREVDLVLPEPCLGREAGKLGGKLCRFVSDRVVTSERGTPARPLVPIALEPRPPLVRTQYCETGPAEPAVCTKYAKLQAKSSKASEAGSTRAE